LGMMSRRVKHNDFERMKNLILRLVAICLLCCAPAWSAGKPAQPQADRIVIVKSERTLTLFRAGKILKTYKVALGTTPVGPKTRQGDGKTPEGLYTVDSRNPHSQFHLSLHVSYPNATDRARAARLKV